MPSRYDPENVNLVREMRMIEKSLAELHTKITVYTGMFEQSRSRVEALKTQYTSLGSLDLNSIDEEPEYRHALEKMNTARRQLEDIERERERLKKILQDNMHRF